MRIILAIKNKELNEIEIIEYKKIFYLSENIMYLSQY